MSDKDDRAGAPASETRGSDKETAELEPPFLDERSLAQRLLASCGTEAVTGPSGTRWLRGEAVDLWKSIEAELTPEARAV